jgi:glycosyltransferase involved in cell wall biosynthesis
MTDDSKQPLVTLAIFTFNQRNTILDAVASAVSQTYAKLEIIVSDDCSSDDTFEICRDYLANHPTEKHVRLRRTARNNGTYSHVLEVAHEARGELFIVQAGDDLSKSNRVAEIVAEWARKRFCALFSDYDIIDNDGNLVRTDVSHEISARVQNIFETYKPAQRSAGHVLNVAGCSAGYDREFLCSLPMPKEKIFSEDALLTYLINALGLEIRKLPKSLLLYRESKNSITGAKGAKTHSMLAQSEHRLCAFAKSNHAMYLYLLDIINRDPSPEIEGLGAKFITRAQYSAYVAAFWEIGPIRRIILAFSEPVRDRVAFLLPRMLGFDTFLVAKKFLTYYRKCNVKGSLRANTQEMETDKHENYTGRSS